VTPIIKIAGAPGVDSACWYDGVSMGFSV